jgi:hypothetical protein
MPGPYSSDSRRARPVVGIGQEGEEAAIRYIERIAEARSMVVERRADFLAAEADN